MHAARSTGAYKVIMNPHFNPTASLATCFRANAKLYKLILPLYRPPFATHSDCVGMREVLLELAALNDELAAELQAFDLVPRIAPNKEAKP